jgi:hypothetical protein
MLVMSSQPWESPALVEATKKRYLPLRSKRGEKASLRPSVTCRLFFSARE